jgi:HIV Tat-specific factor 1
VLKQSSKANTSIYIKGLPDDVSLEELKEFFSKAGVIKSDVETGDSKIKIYRDELGRVKGDALVSYIKSESVELAI